MSRPWITRFSSRSARGRRMMGSGGRGASICPATFSVLLPFGSGLSTRSPRPSSPRERHWLRFFRRKLKLRSSSCLCRRGSLLAPAELRLVNPHAMQDDRQLAGDRNPSARDAAPFGYLHSPGPQRGPFPTADKQRVGRLVECRAGQLVAASADPALHVGL